MAKPFVNNSKKREAFRRQLFAAQNGECHLGSGCFLPGKPMTLRRGKDSLRLQKTFATFDHLVPVKAGGSAHRDNFALAHSFCNSKRGHKDILLC